MFYTVADGHKSVGLRHNPLNTLVAPRPIGWISTVDNKGRANLAPFSYFNLVAADPPCVMFSPNAKDDQGTPKDTYKNVRESGEFVVNVAPWRLRHAMNLTSTTLPHGESEFALAGLTPESSRLVHAPRVKESPGALECKLLQIIDLPRGRQGRQYHVILGEVVAVHIDDEVVVDGSIDVMKLAPMARMGGFDYTFVNFLEVIPRPAGGE